MKKDTDSIILKYEQENIADIECDIEKLNKCNGEQEIQLLQLQEKLAKLNGNKKQKTKLKRPTINIRQKKTITTTDGELNYKQLYIIAEKSLIERGLDIDELDFHNLVSEEELNQTIKELNAALPREEKWTKPDFIVMFIVALIACVADIILSNRDNKFTRNGSDLSTKLNKLHEETFKHKPGAPIDYQGKGFGGGYHRELSKGHDLLRFVDGIKMFKEGAFEGVRYIDGVPHKVISHFTPKGKAYAQLPTIEAIINYAQHMFADLFSIYSLPFPGYSFLAECDSREIRILAADMYKNGFNLKNVITQSISAIIIEVIIRLYYSIQSVRNYSKQLDIDENYSNINAFKEFINPEHKDKLNEMLLVSHSIVMAENVGKITFRCIASSGLDAASLVELNITEIVAVVRYGASVVKALAARNDEYAKLMYHTNEVNDTWHELEQQLNDDELSIIDEMPNTLII